MGPAVTDRRAHVAFHGVLAQRCSRRPARDL